MIDNSVTAAAAGSPSMCRLDELEEIWLLIEQNYPPSPLLAKKSFTPIPVKLKECSPRAYLASLAKQSFTPTAVEPKELSFQVLMEGVVKAFQMANISYGGRTTGLFYCDCYPGIIDPEEQFSIKRFSNPDYFKITGSCGFRVFEGKSPAQALQAFFCGPTIAECNTATQACFWFGILEMLGSDEFDRLFNTSMLPFFLSEGDLGNFENSEDVLMVGTIPICSFFDPVPHDSIEIGDYLYIQGHLLYADKHPAGASQGWNVICVGHNNVQKPLYTGFCPLLFGVPRTYEEILQFLVDGFNAPQTERDLYVIEKRKLGNFLENATCTTADMKGITDHGRFDFNRLLYYFRNQPKKWCDRQISKQPEAPSGTLHGTPIQVKNRENTFANYKVDTQIQTKMRDLAYKFAQEVCDERRIIPAGLVMTGMQGIGKTHLGVAVVSYALNHGKSVLYLSADILEKIFNSYCAEMKSADKAMDRIMDEWTAYLALKPDLIILDDLNLELISKVQFQKMAVTYTMRHNKALFIIANMPISNLQEGLEQVYKLTDPRAHCFVFEQGLQVQSNETIGLKSVIKDDAKFYV